MNRKQFIILLLAVLVAGGAGLLIYERGNNSWESSSAGLGGKLLPNLAINDVAQITLQTGTNELHLARQGNLWRVQERGGYPANFSQISDGLIKLSDLKIVQTLETGPSQLARFDLLPPGPGANTATLVQLADANGKVLATLWLGKQHIEKTAGQQPPGMDENGWPDGRYVMPANGGATVDVISDPLDNTEAKPEQWLDKDFLTVEKPESISVEFPAATNSWTITRVSETNDWQLAAAGPKEKLDASKISDVSSAFSSPSFTDVLPRDTKAGAAGLTNITRVTINTFDGLTYTAKIGQKEDDNYPVTFAITAAINTNNAALAAPGASGTNAPDREKWLADKLARGRQYEQWIYLLPSYDIDPLLRPRSDLLLAETNTVSSAATAK